MNIAWLSHSLHSGRCGRRCERQKSGARIQKTEERKEKIEKIISNNEYRTENFEVRKTS